MAVNDKELTFLVCTRNGARTIREAVDKCIGELARLPAGTGELMVVDNGSSDATVSIVEDARRGHEGLVTLLHASKPGKNHAFEAGVRAARGRIVCIVDDDNFIEPGFAGHLLAFFDDYPDVGIVGANKRLDESIEPPPWFEWAKDHLACSTPQLRENRTTDHLGRDVADLGYIAGAGMGFRKDPVVQALDAGYRFFNDAVRGRKISGEDIELCFLIRSMGFRFGYEPRMKLRHCLAANRLTKQAFWALCETVGAGSLGIDPFMFTKKLPGPPFPIQYSWYWQLFAKIRQLILSQMLPESAVAGVEQRRFRKKRLLRQHWGAVRRIAMERSAYTQHIRHVAAGPWTRLRVQ
jgi:glycosyltransferase involved in cell wall biosynthesis